MMVEAICDLREQERADVRTTAPPNGSCCRRARDNRWVDRPSGDLPAALHLRLAAMFESLAAELGR